MKSIFKFILIFLSVIVGYHVFYTCFLYGLDMGSSFVFSAMKDIVWILLIWMVLLGGRRYLWVFWKQGKWALIVLSVLVFWSLWLSVAQGISVKMMLVGLKYDVYPLVLLVSWILIGFILKLQAPSHKLQTDFIYRVIVFIVVWWLIWQVGKIFLPELFHWIGYWPVGDYVLWANPPLYYRTGPWGMMRLQGLFSGPNNYGYFLVGFFSVVIGLGGKLKAESSKLQASSWKLQVDSSFTRFNTLSLFVLLYVFSLFWTLSRGVLVGVGVQVFLLVWFFKKAWRKYLWWFVLLWVLALWWLSIWKRWSTVGHFQAWFEWWHAFIDNPLGYGLGSAWPAVHYSGIYLPENHYLQLLLDVGVVWLFLWMGVLGSIVYMLATSWKLKATSYKLQAASCKLLLVLLWFGFIGLLVEGLFLHVFEDSMVNYLFLVVFGVMIGAVSAWNGK